MSRLSTKQRRSAARRRAAVRPLEYRRMIRQRYANLTAADVQRRWAELAAHPTLEQMREHLDRHFLQPLIAGVMAQLNSPRRRWLTLSPPEQP